MWKPDIQFDFHWSMQGSEGFHTVVLQRQHLELGPGFEKISFQKPNGISMLEADNTAIFLLHFNAAFLVWGVECIFILL